MHSILSRAFLIVLLTFIVVVAAPPPALPPSAPAGDQNPQQSVISPALGPWQPDDGCPFEHFHHQDPYLVRGIDPIRRPTIDVRLQRFIRAALRRLAWVDGDELKDLINTFYECGVSIADFWIYSFPLLAI
jgi:hypothetical protein